MVPGMMAPTAPKDEFLAGVLEESATKSTGEWVRNGYAPVKMNLVNEAAAMTTPC